MLILMEMMVFLLIAMFVRIGVIDVDLVSDVAVGVDVDVDVGVDVDIDVGVDVDGCAD